MFLEVIATKNSLCKFSVFFLSVLLVLGLSSCAYGKTYDTKKVLYEMIKSEEKLPAGNIYSFKSSPGAPNYISSSLLSALYGEGSTPEVLSNAEDISLRLSSGLYCFELAVFLCPNTRDANEIADLCLRRIDTMEHFFNANSEKLGIDPACLNNIKNAKVAVVGRYVLMAVSPNAADCIKGAKNIIS